MDDTFRFRTPVSIPPAEESFSYATPWLCMGSCFAEHLGQMLEDRLFDCLTNPFGIVYNPLALARQLQRLRVGTPYEATELVRQHGLWHSWDHHGRFSHPSRDQALAGMNRALQAGQRQMQRQPWLLLTLGTAWVYELKDSRYAVANNHKFPASAFTRRLLDVAEVVSVLQKALAPSPQAARILLTVSPVRHLHDGLVANQRSKATLLLAVHELCDRLPQAHYFPAYEILLDELRDYRFYQADMTHPSPQAVDYVWDKFRAIHLANESREPLKEVESLLQAVRHRPIHPDTEAHRTFCQKQLEKIKRLNYRYPEVDLGRFHMHFEQQLPGQ